MHDLTTLARKMMLTPTQAIAIAGVVDHAAQSMGWTRKQMVAECFRNAEACEYLGSVCRRVMS